MKAKFLLLMVMCAYKIAYSQCTTNITSTNGLSFCEGNNTTLHAVSDFNLWAQKSNFISPRVELNY